MRRVLLEAVSTAATLGLLPLAACTVGDAASFDGGLFPDDPDGAVQQEPEVDAAVTPGGDGGDVDAGVDGADAAFGGSDAGSDLEEVARWPGQLAAAICDALEDCLGPDLLADAFRGRDCTRLRRNRLQNGELGYLVDSVEAGRVLFSAEDIEACLADVRALGCSVESSRLPASCELAVLGTVPLDGECAINEDCAGDAFCDKGRLATCPGTCAPLQSVGQPCHHDDDAQCEDGLICFQDSTCEPLGEDGDECAAGTLPSCAPGLVCLDEGSGPRCAGLARLYFRTLEEPCDVTQALCEPGSVCESVDETEGVCALPVGPGEACKRAEPNQCPMDQYCDAEQPGESGVCADRPTDGEPCLDRSAACAGGHVCIDDVCRPLLPIGEDCLDDVQCYSGDCGDFGFCEGPLMCTP